MKNEQEYNDYPIDECLNTAAPLVLKGATIHQKWTCGHCKSRQTMEIPNKFFRAGKCEECGQMTTIAKCNYLLIQPLGGVNDGSN